jgi:hypothetical protein
VDEVEEREVAEGRRSGGRMGRAATRSCRQKNGFRSHDASLVDKVDCPLIHAESVLPEGRRRRRE